MICTCESSDRFVQSFSTFFAHGWNLQGVAGATNRYNSDHWAGIPPLVGCTLLGLRCFLFKVTDALEIIRLRYSNLLVKENMPCTRGFFLVGLVGLCFHCDHSIFTTVVVGTCFFGPRALLFAATWWELNLQRCVVSL